MRILLIFFILVPALGAATEPTVKQPSWLSSCLSWLSINKVSFTDIKNAHTADAWVHARAEELWNWVEARKPPIKTDPAAFRLPKWNPLNRKELKKAIYKRLRNPNAFQVWITNLFYECAEETRQDKRAEAKLNYSNGQLYEGASVRVLLRLAKTHGWKRVVTLSTITAVISSRRY